MLTHPLGGKRKSSSLTQGKLRIEALFSQLAVTYKQDIINEMRCRYSLYLEGGKRCPRNVAVD
jgi:hypothetical protein